MFELKTFVVFIKPFQSFHHALLVVVAVVIITIIIIIIIIIFIPLANKY